jgi:ribosomal protein L12E/L44/L45/RPP1/RPP2
VRPFVVTALLAGLCSAARADDTRVRATTTVEVLDDKAQIDDVISRIKKEQPAPPSSTEHDPPTAELKRDRGARAADRRHDEDEKLQKSAGPRRTNRERPEHPERSERTERVRRRP